MNRLGHVRSNVTLTGKIMYEMKKRQRRPFRGLYRIMLSYWMRKGWNLSDRVCRFKRVPIPCNLERSFIRAVSIENSHLHFSYSLSSQCVERMCENERRWLVLRSLILTGHFCSWQVVDANHARDQEINLEQKKTTKKQQKKSKSNITDFLRYLFCKKRERGSKRKSERSNVSSSKRQFINNIGQRTIMRRHKTQTNNYATVSQLWIRWRSNWSSISELWGEIGAMVPVRRGNSTRLSVLCYYLHFISTGSQGSERARQNVRVKLLFRVC